MESWRNSLLYELHSETGDVMKAISDHYGNYDTTSSESPEWTHLKEMNV